MGDERGGEKVEDSRELGGSKSGGGHRWLDLQGEKPPFVSDKGLGEEPSHASAPLGDSGTSSMLGGFHWLYINLELPTSVEQPKPSGARQGVFRQCTRDRPSVDRRIDHLLIGHCLSI